MKNKLITSSVVAAMLLGSSAYAGKIIGAEPGDSFVPQTQFGFGGWNLDNVAVKIVSTEDFSTNIGTFSETDGTYSEMTYGMSFESEISNLEGTVMALLHGKDWPVGEPAGIKIINGDTVKNGKPVNCIMTSSYMSAEDNPLGVDGYLDADEPAPTLCSSAFQTHKRFKVNMMPTTVAGYDTTTRYGKPIDLVFNLDPNDQSGEIDRYQVLQKINNYTDMRLDGYKIEVLGADGFPNDALTLSLGIGEDKNNTDIWDVDDMANFSHGLWGPKTFEEPPHFPEDGFFDKLRAYFTVNLSDDNKTIETTHGKILGGNYNLLFGNWLPSKWQPSGVFFDDDNDTTTDAKLVAFWGTTPDEPAATPAWHKGMADGWAEPTVEELAEWKTNSLYSMSYIEDTLNLGLNYIVNVGSYSDIGATFTIRITPHVAVDQTAPTYVDIVPTDPTVDPVVDPTVPRGSSGFDAYDNRSLLMMIFGFLGIGALIARRKLAK